MSAGCSRCAYCHPHEMHQPSGLARPIPLLLGGGSREMTTCSWHFHLFPRFPKPLANGFSLCTRNCGQRVDLSCHDAYKCCSASVGIPQTVMQAVAAIMSGRSHSMPPRLKYKYNANTSVMKEADLGYQQVFHPLYRLCNRLLHMYCPATSRTAQAQQMLMCLVFLPGRWQHRPPGHHLPLRPDSAAADCAEVSSRFQRGIAPLGR